MTFQGAKVRKPLLAVSGVIDKGNIVVFAGSGSFILPSSCAGVASVSKVITGFKDAHRCMRKMESSSCGRGNLRTGRPRISVGGKPIEGAGHQAEKAWTTRETVERKRIGSIW